jgi:hypothetical protein
MIETSCNLLAFGEKALKGGRLLFVDDERRR